MNGNTVNRVILFIICPVLMLCAAACLDDPVAGDYYNNINLIKGKTRPQAPCIAVNTDETCEYTVQFDVGCLKDLNGIPTPDDESDDTCVYTVADCEDDSDTDLLRYYLYVSSGDPGTVMDFDYYSPLYLWMEVYLGEPDNPNNKVTSSSDNTFYFWAASWDGGRLSNHSNVVEVEFPSATVCP